MLDTDFVKLLRCPVNGQPLELADEELTARVNAAIEKGVVKSRRGDVVERAIDGGLKDSSGKWLYPIINEIPTLLADEAISLETVPQTVEGEIEGETV